MMTKCGEQNEAFSTTNIDSAAEKGLKMISQH